MEKYNTYLAAIDRDFFQALCCNEGDIRLYQRQEYFLTEGETFPYIGFVESGVFKYTCQHATEKRSCTIGFSFAGEFVGDYPNCLYQVPSPVSIQALTSCRVHICPVHVLAEKFGESMENQQLARQAAEQLFTQIYNRYIDQYRYSAEDRYLQLLRRYPELVQQVPLKEIASFLRITPVHMSRIRKKQWRT